MVLFIRLERTKALQTIIEETFDVSFMIIFHGNLAGQGQGHRDHSITTSEWTRTFVTCVDTKQADERFTWRTLTSHPCIINLFTYLVKSKTWNSSLMKCVKCPCGSHVAMY